MVSDEAAAAEQHEKQRDDREAELRQDEPLLVSARYGDVIGRLRGREMHEEI